MAVMGLSERATALYSLPLDQFIAARNTASAEAAAAGDRELATALRALPKPTSAAWLVNVLVVRRRDQVEQVLELGVSIRDVQASGDRARLHALGQQRRRLIGVVAAQSLEVAAEIGYEVGAAALPHVEHTLSAALSDRNAAAAVLSGRLVRPLESAGWDPVDLEGAVGGPVTTPTPTDQETRGPEAAVVARGGGRGTGSPAPAAAGTRRRSKKVAGLVSARAELSTAEDAAGEARRTGRHLAAQRARIVTEIEALEQRLASLRADLADIDHAAEASTAADQRFVEARHIMFEAETAVEATDAG